MMPRPGHFEHARHLQGDAQRLVLRHAAPHPLPDGLAFDELEDEVVAVGALQDVVDAADVRMLELGEQPCLAQETPAHRRHALVRVDDFDRDGPLQPLVEPPVHLPHPADADQAIDPDAADAVAGFQGHV
jgi:hypothetical protein